MGGASKHDSPGPEVPLSLLDAPILPPRCIPYSPEDRGWKIPVDGPAGEHETESSCNWGAARQFSFAVLVAIALRFIV